jgi:hypothetical protein
MVTKENQRFLLVYKVMNDIVVTSPVNRNKNGSTLQKVQKSLYLADIFY